MSPLRGRFMLWLAPRFFEAFICALGATLRVRVRDEAGFLDAPSPCVVVFWHNRLMMMPWMYRRLGVTLPLTVLMSRSKDGQIVTGIAARFGVGAVRGSSSRGAAVAVRGLVALLRGGGAVGITPDGPRGPRYEIKPGMAHLARAAGVPVLPVTLHYAWKWQAKSWDRLQIPMPFSRVEFVVFKPVAFDLPDLEEQVKRALGV